MGGLDALVIEPLGKRHDRDAFSCGQPELDRYFQKQAGQDMRRNVARVFVCTKAGADTIIGFYTLSAASVDLSVFPENVARKLPHHPVPGALIGRLAVDRTAQGQGVGRMLLADALKRTLAASANIAVHVLVVDAKTDAAKAFYQAFGFTAFEDDTRRLFLPLGRI
ncbi:MAG: GNAT family N-acetyltransferase [Rhodospirillales bacterium]|nr:GNAT family N-acetyltransferase [Rhodospirillales bacterium]